MRTTHLLWTGTVAVHPRQEVLTEPRQFSPPVTGRADRAPGWAAVGLNTARLPAGPRQPAGRVTGAVGPSGVVTTLAGMLIGAHVREDDPVVSAAERGADIVQL